MQKSILVIADPDETYMGFVAKFLRTTDYSTAFDIRLFASAEHLQRFLKATSKIDVLLISPQLTFTMTENTHLKVKLCIDLIETSMEGKHTPYIFKYQPLNQLLMQVVQHVEDQQVSCEDAQDEINKNSLTKLFGVYSSTGGAGKTAFSMHLGSHLVRSGNKVFVLDLQSHPIHDVMFDSTEPKDAAQFYYYLQSKPDRLHEEWQQFIRTDAQTGIDFFGWTFRLEDTREVSAKHIRWILKLIQSSGQYDAIVIDMDHTLTEKESSVFLASDHIYWLLTPDVQCFHKSWRLWSEYEHWFQVKEGRGQLHIVLNRYTGELATELEAYQLPIHAYLPYIPHWKMLTSMQQWLKEDVYEQAIAQCYALSQKMFDER